MVEDKLTGYDLSRDFFDWCFENPELVKPSHIAIYMFAIEHCNRLGWKPKFGFPSQMTMDAIGIKNYKTYIKSFNDLLEWGFFVLHEKSKNQYSANVIGIVKNTKAHTKALSKARQKHLLKQVQSIASIDKHITNEHIKPITEEIEILCKENFEKVFKAFEKWKDYLAKQHDTFLKENEYTYQILLGAVKKFGGQKTIENIDYSISRNWKQILERQEEKVAKSNIPKNVNAIWNRE